MPWLLSLLLLISSTLCGCRRDRGTYTTTTASVSRPSRDVLFVFSSFDVCFTVRICNDNTYHCDRFFFCVILPIRVVVVGGGVGATAVGKERCDSFMIHLLERNSYTLFISHFPFFFFCTKNHQYEGYSTKKHGVWFVVVI